MKHLYLILAALFISISSFALTPITGPSSVCNGQIITLSNATLGGTWASSNTSVATVGSSSGVVTGSAAGTAIITYTLGIDYELMTITVNPLPTPITGTTFVCDGLTTTFADGTPGGTWSSSILSVATIGSSTGVATGIAPGTSTITYTLPTGCIATTTLRVNPMPATISGVTGLVCTGSRVTLTDATPGGTWISSTPSVASVVVSTGVVTGVSTGTSIITYKVFTTGCLTTVTVSVGGGVAAITGTAAFCVGTTSTLSNSTPGGTWISSLPSVAAIGSATGIATGIVPGTARITYTVGSCSAYYTVTVNATSASISGASTVCVGSIISLTGATSGGVWSVGTGVASVGTSSGFVTGLAAGFGTVTYTVSGICGLATAFHTLTVSSTSSAGSITGPTVVCEGSAVSLSSSVSGGTWSGSTSVASVSSGRVDGITAGAAVVTYTVPGCGGPAIATHTVIVNPLPATISGPGTVCPGSTITLVSTTTGGTWVSSAPAVATIDAGGTVSGISSGTTAISYFLSTGCSTGVTVTVSPATTAGIISGTSIVCTASTVTLSSSVPGGMWSSSALSVATIGSSSGIATGVSAGSSVISYTLATPCGTAVVTRTITVTGTLSAGTISGTTSVCVGSTGTLSSTVPGGTWASTFSGVASIGATTGIVYGVSSGTAVISYSVSVCSGTAVATTTVTINLLPSTITGITGLCIGNTTSFSNSTTGGTWSSSNVAVATIGSSTGIAMAVTAGTATITYTLPTGCSATTNINVNAAPAAITGTATVCVGSTVTMSNATSGGTWLSSNPAVGSIVVSTGVVTGNSVGITTITYRVFTTGCIATRAVTVTPVPGSISGTATLCAGSATTLSNSITGGSWISGTLPAATIDAATGIVSGVSAGTSVITYTMGGSCFVTTVVTVNATPAAFAISGGGSYCVGGTGVSIGLGGSAAGVGYQLYEGSTPVGSVVAGTGSALGFGAHTTAGIYTVSATNAGTGCSAAMTGSATVSILSLPVITASASAICTSDYTLTGGGGVTYSWAPSAGLSCATCAVTTTNPAVTTTYTVIGTDAAGCTSTATTTVNGDRIMGHITFSSTVPDTLDAKVWLIQYDPSDSSLTALDSMLTCLDGGSPYFQFNSKPTGSYLVKAKLLFGNPAGASGYVPTYGASSAIWSGATGITHTSGSNTQDINMIYGTVPAGPGFIGGLIVSGAGRGTAGEIPVARMLVYLKDAATGNILTHAYTNSLGEYSFGSLAYGTYIIYPEDFSYATVASSTLTLSSSVPSATGVNFKQFLTSEVIAPFFIPTAATQLNCSNAISCFPNPTTGNINLQWNSQQIGAAQVTIADAAGRQVYNSSIQIANAAGSAVLTTEGLANGIYFITVRTAGSAFNGKISVQK